MKKALRIIGWIVGLVILLDLFVSCFSDITYDLICTRCLRQYVVTEDRFCGITYWKTNKLTFPGYDLEQITGRPCQHIYRKGGYVEDTYSLFGIGMGDGITGEGAIFQMRWQVLREAFKIYQQFPDKNLMLETLSFIDTCLPPDATFEYRGAYSNQSYLMLLSQSLGDVRSAQDWKTALNNVKSQMASEEKAH